jgi:hypothetical protein
MRLPGLTAVGKNYPLLPLAVQGNQITLLSCIKCIAVTLVIPSLVCLGAWVDGTWEMQGNARGLSRHYGFWVQCATTPAIILLSAGALSAFLRAIGSLERYSISGVVPKDLRRLAGSHVISICLLGDSRFILYFAMLIGGMWTAVNIVETSNPTATYGNPVFDSPEHLYGFLTTKLFLVFNWALVYPITLFIVIHITWSMVLILRYMCSHRLLRIDFFHSDNCGGVSAFGTINLLIMGVYLNFFLVIASLALTHSARYSTLTLSALFASIIFVVQSFGAVYYIHRFVAIKKHEFLVVINNQLDIQMLTTVAAGQFSSDLLMARNHLISLRTYPYTRQVAAVVNAIRLSPALLGLLKFFPHFS